MISATLPNEILEITSKFMTDPVRILVKRDELTLEVRPLFCKVLPVDSRFDGFFPNYGLHCFRELNNSLLQWKEKSGNLILSVIFMIPLP